MMKMEGVMPQMPSAMMQQVGGEKSVYHSAQAEAQRMVKLKEILEVEIGEDVTSWDKREGIIRLADVCINEIYSPMSAGERLKLKQDVDDLKKIHKKMTDYEKFYDYAEARGARLAMNPPNPRDFLNQSNLFLRDWNAALYHLDLGLRMKRQITEFKKIYSVLDAPNIWYNDYGLPVSMETEFLARNLINRTFIKWDNVIFVEGKPGSGKSQSAFSLATTMATLSKKHHFDLHKSVFLKEPRDVVEDYIRNAAMYSIIVLDEAGNQLNSKLWYENEQIFFTNMLSLIRGLGHTILVLWKESTSIDKSMRQNRAILTARASRKGSTKKGLLTVRTYNENPYAIDSLHRPAYLKNKVILDATKAAELQALDPTTLMQCPMYNLDDTDFWREYWDTMKFPNMRKSLQEILHTKPNEPQTIEFFFKNTAIESTIDSKQVAAFNTQYETSLDLEKVASYIEFKLNLKSKELYRGSNYVILPPKAQEYLNKFKEVKD